MTSSDVFGPAGRELWSAVADAFDLEPHHAALLASACRCADMITRLERLLDDGLIVEGSQGQPRLSSAVTELRQHRLALSKLLTDLALPGDDDASPSLVVEAKRAAASRKASRAAHARWSRHQAGGAA